MYLRCAEVTNLIGVSRTTLWRLVRAGAFPRPHVLSTNRVGFLVADVDAWIASRRPRQEAALVAPAPQRPHIDHPDESKTTSRGRR